MTTVAACQTRGTENLLSEMMLAGKATHALGGTVSRARPPLKAEEAALARHQGWSDDASSKLTFGRYSTPQRNMSQYENNLWTG